MAIALYIPSPVKRQSYKGVKELTVPNQSMSLKEILQRFIRRESLPVEKLGIYNDQLGDLEKMQNEDITIKMDRVNDLRTKINSANARMKAKAQAEFDAAVAAKIESDAAAVASRVAAASSPAPPA